MPRSLRYPRSHRADAVGRAVLTISVKGSGHVKGRLCSGGYLKLHKNKQSLGVGARKQRVLTVQAHDSSQRRLSRAQVWKRDVSVSGPWKCLVQFDNVSSAIYLIGIRQADKRSKGNHAPCCPLEHSFMVSRRRQNPRHHRPVRRPHVAQLCVPRRRREIQWSPV
jgi:hypothetical protein